jgi:Membrane protein involved in the export of O-antigen and teichoic acid
MKIIKTFLSFSIGTWIGAAIGIITIPLLTHFFSPEDMGKASMFQLALNILMLFTLFGIDQAFIRFFYEEKTEKLLSKCLALTSIVYACLMVLLYAFRHHISLYLFDEYVPEMIHLLAVTTIINVLNSYAVSIVRMEQKGLLYSIIQICLRLFELIFIGLLLLLMTRDYSIMVYAKTITLLVVTLYAIYATKNIWGKIEAKPGPSVYSYKDIFNFSYPLALTALITWALQSIDKLALKEWSTLTELGIYTAAFKIVLVLQIVQTSFTTYWIPLSYERFNTNQNDETNRLFFSKVSQGISFVMLLGGVLLIMCKDLVALILGAEYASAVSMIPFLVFMPILYTISETTTIGLNFHKKVKVILLISVLTLITAIIGNYWLVPAYNGIGAAMSIGISSIVFFVLRTHFSLKYFPVDYKLGKLYILIFLIFGFAAYSSFYNWSMVNVIIGLALLILTTSFYYTNIKTEIKRFL